jgi:hypothetical protein
MENTSPGSKKKNTLFEERSDEFVFFPKREDEQRKSNADIQRRRGRVPSSFDEEGLFVKMRRG